MISVGFNSSLKYALNKTLAAYYTIVNATTQKSLSSLRICSLKNSNGVIYARSYASKASNLQSVRIVEQSQFNAFHTIQELVITGNLVCKIVAHLHLHFSHNTWGG